MSKKNVKSTSSKLAHLTGTVNKETLAKTPSLVFEKEIAFLACTLNKAEKIPNPKSQVDTLQSVRGTTPIVTYQPLNENV